MGNILKNIKEIRKERGYGQEYMAFKLEMSQAGYALWEKGERELTYNNLSRIADVLNVPVIDIITYPKRFVDISTIPLKQEKVSVTFEVDPQQRDYLLHLVMGDAPKK